MSGRWREDDDEDYRIGGSRGGPGGRAKPRFSFKEVKLLLDEVKRNRYILLRKFNHGVSAEIKKQTWNDITDQINDLGENHREVRQIMKKWADLKCDGKRRLVALRGPNGSNLRKKNLGPVEKMVHKILLMTPGRDVNSDLDWDDDDDDEGSRKRRRSAAPAPPPPFSYLSMTETNSMPLPGGASFDLSPHSTPEKDLSGDPFRSSPDFDFDLPEDGERSVDFDNDDAMVFPQRSSLRLPSSGPLDPIAGDPVLRTKPVHTYSRNNSSSSSSKPAAAPVFPSTSSDPHQTESNPSSASPPLQPLYQSFSSSTSFPSNGSTSHLPPPTSSSAILPPPTSSSSSVFPPPPPPSSSSLRPRPSSSSVPSIRSSALPPGASSLSTAREQIAQTVTLSLLQQQASRRLLTSMSHSLESLTQSVQLLVESQQEYIQESLQLQRETVDSLRDFYNTTMTMLRGKAGNNNTNNTNNTHITPPPPQPPQP